jgi:hypothetical protein
MPSQALPKDVAWRFLTISKPRELLRYVDRPFGTVAVAGLLV